LRELIFDLPDSFPPVEQDSSKKSPTHCLKVLDLGLPSGCNKQDIFVVGDA